MRLAILLLPSIKLNNGMETKIIKFSYEYYVNEIHFSFQSNQKLIAFIFIQQKYLFKFTLQEDGLLHT